VGLLQGLKGVPEQEVEARLKNVIDIFKYLQDKDVFEDFYKQHLAGRLLSGQSTNADVEKAMIAKLKVLHACFGLARDVCLVYLLPHSIVVVVLIV
jgi:cullin 3